MRWPWRKPKSESVTEWRVLVDGDVLFYESSMEDALDMAHVEIELDGSDVAVEWRVVVTSEWQEAWRG